ncbi:MAG TPA: cation transporter [Stellaceae bacterium]|nr:cation transporter [Stellaceae bacterium]
MTAAPLTPDQRAKEQAIAFALGADTAILLVITVVALLGGSLTLMAESVRGALMDAIEGFALLVMRRIHRGRLVGFEFGPGKLEQVATLAIAIGMLGGAVWIALGAAALATGERAIGTPLGLALAAIVGALNTYINLIAWDAVRRAARGERSLIMQGQLTARTVKLVSSLVVQFSLTVAAISTDDLVIAWADAAGAFFVVGFIVVTAVGMLRAGFSDLVDRAVEEEVQHAINRALARHFGDYDRFERVRSRRSGQRVFIEVALGFDGRLTMEEVDRRITALSATMQGEIAEADIAILASSHRV